MLYATSRKGLDLGFQTASGTKVKYPQLDIADKESIRGFVETVKKEEGKVDVLINNAGVNVDDEYSPENVKVTLDTNVRGTLQVGDETFSILSSVFLSYRLGNPQEPSSSFEIKFCLPKTSLVTS